mmetsp:Transcript_11654/g.17706  ORF Transcript_11654/g.17706 Transcript_11654/m.17706 type:complete len:109 (-) Transcript_11654:2697-3023(-)
MTKPFQSDNSATPAKREPSPEFIVRPSISSQSRSSLKHANKQQIKEEVTDLNWLEERRLEQVRTFINMFQTINLLFQIDSALKFESLPTTLQILQPLYYLMFLVTLGL